MAQGMTIGQLAEAAGVGIETVRYYQRRGLLSKPSIPMGGRRHYSENVLRQIAFIRRAQDLGFTLDEVKGLLSLGDGRNCRAGRDFAQNKLNELKLRVTELNRMVRKLGEYVKRCNSNGNSAKSCPFIAALNSAEQPKERKR